MSKLFATPDQETLRRFMLGTLPSDEAEAVAQWLEENPDAAVVLRDIQARDTVTDAIGAGGPGSSSIPQLIHTAVQINAPAPVPAPDTVGGYRILSELGRGGMGVVYEAEDAKLGRYVAIKVIATEFAASPEARERFLREARAVAKIDHPNVVPILHIGEEVPAATPEGFGGQLYLVMPLLKGETLDERLKREKRLPAAEVVRIGREIAAGLAAAHAVGIVHRDIKPANIWLEADTGRARILDFGLAKPMTGAAAPDLTSTGAVMGTPFYMSPEQAEGKPVDARSDLFSLGAVLYHAATGERPFKGDSKLAVLIAVKDTTPPRAETLITDLPQQLAAVIRALMEKNPNARPTTATEVVEQLSTVPAAKPAPAPRRFPRWKHAAIALGAFLILGAVVTTIVVTVRDKDGKVVAQIVVPPGGSVGVEPGPTDPIPSDPDRKAAEIVLSLGGQVRVNGEDRTRTAADGLPEGQIRLTLVVLSANASPKNKAKVDDAILAKFKDCKHITMLTLFSKDVSDEGLANFKNCKNLTRLALNECVRITDRGLENFKDCKSLTSLVLREVQVTNPGLAHFKDCNDLTELSLIRVWVSDPALVHFQNCKKLTHLTLSETQVTDEGLAYFKNCKNLTRVSLARRPITEAGLEHLKDCPNLYDLDLTETQVKDAAIARMKNWKLQRLLLHGAPITDACVADLKECTALRELSLSGTKITAAKIKELAEALPKCKIYWDGGVIEPKK